MRDRIAWRQADGSGLHHTRRRCRHYAEQSPVNGLGLSTRTGIVEGIERAQNDPAIKAIVLTGAGKAFSGGADITEFNTPKALQEPTLGTVIHAVENSPKPVVAAIHSV